MPKKAATVSVTELADLLDKNEETLRLWRQKGCPHQVERGRPRFVVAKVVDWLRDQERRAAEPQDIEEAERREAIARARLAELKVGAEEARLIPVEESAKVVEKLLSDLRAQLVTFPQRVAPGLLGCKTVVEVQSRLDHAIGEAMHALSGAE